VSRDGGRAAEVRGRLLVALALTSWAVTGCGSEEPTTRPEPEPSVTARPSPSETSSAPAPISRTDEAKAVLRDALRRWRAADTGEFTQTLDFGSAGSQTTTGVYQLSSRSTAMEQSTETAEGESFEFEFLAIRDVGYMNTQGWPAEIRECWLTFDGAALEESTGIEAVPGAGGLPAHVIALSYARGAAVDPTDSSHIIGTVDLPTAVSVFGSGAARFFEDMTIKASVEADFTLTADGDIESWSVEGDDLLTAMGREGLLEGVTDDVRAELGSLRAETTYQNLGSTRVDVRPPTRAQQMTPDQMEALQGCPAAR
jgi:hypothetical protein